LVLRTFQFQLLLLPQSQLLLLLPLLLLLFLEMAVSFLQLCAQVHLYLGETLYQLLSFGACLSILRNTPEGGAGNKCYSHYKPHKVAAFQLSFTTFAKSYPCQSPPNRANKHFTQFKVPSTSFECNKHVLISATSRFAVHSTFGGAVWSTMPILHPLWQVATLNWYQLTSASRPKQITRISSAASNLR
jgi:hypothetical protein